MKIQATVIIKLQAGSLSEAGGVLDDVLSRAKERDDVEVGQVTLMTPPGPTPVMLPPVSAPADFSTPQAVSTKTKSSS
jgi:hypothetical protein